MDDALLMRRFERFSNLPRDGQGFIERNCAAGNSLREILPFDEFHHEGLDAVGVFQSVDGRDVRMVHRGEDFGFGVKTREAIGVRGGGGRQNLDRALTFQPRVGGPIHLPHPAFADLCSNVVNAETGTGCEGQVWRDYTGLATASAGFLLSDAAVASDTAHSGLATDGSSPAFLSPFT